MENGFERGSRDAGGQLDSFAVRSGWGEPIVPGGSGSEDGDYYRF